MYGVPLFLCKMHINEISALYYMIYNLYKFIEIKIKFKSGREYDR